MSTLSKRVISSSLSLATYYSPATSLQSAAGAFIALTFLTLLVATLYVAFQVYHRERTHFLKGNDVAIESERTHIQTRHVDEEAPKAQ